jgi:hypothetical protein
MKQITAECTCKCHPNGKIPAFQRRSMVHLHQCAQDRRWNEIKRAIRNDVSVAMRIDDSAEEDDWFHSARKSAWQCDVCPSNLGACYNDGRLKEDSFTELPTKQSANDIIQSNSQDELPVRYWVSHAHNGQSAIRQRRTLLHSISKLKFHSDEALIAQLSSGDCQELHDLVEAGLTVRMIIDASVNELRPIEEGCYNELLEDYQANICQYLDRTCNECSCFYEAQYCPPVGLDPVECYMVNTEDKQSSNQTEQVLHKSALTVTDGLGATPLHLLTGEGSAHIDLVRVFLDGCLFGEDENNGDNARRPSVLAILSAQNGHGCTPLHFLSGESII